MRCSICSLGSLCLLYSSTVQAFALAQPAAQVLDPRSQYQGGWPLGLAGSTSTACPPDTPVQSTNKGLSLNCCPAGQTLFNYNFANYCCPTDADCYTGVENFPRCANATWNMFMQSPTGFFCCEPGAIAINPISSPAGGLCESPDQVIPKSLLATMVSQVGVATPAPSATATGSVNATATGTNPTQTNPTLPNSSTPSLTSTSLHAINLNSKNGKIVIAAGVIGIVVFIIILIVAAIFRKNRRTRIIDMRNTNYNAGYDQYGNAYSGYGVAGGYEPLRRAETPANNVTVNVVQGDLQGDGVVHR